jgi:hypothetical protein
MDYLYKRKGQLSKQIPVQMCHTSSDKQRLGSHQNQKGSTSTVASRSTLGTGIMARLRPPHERNGVSTESTIRNLPCYLTLAKPRGHGEPIWRVKPGGLGGGGWKRGGVGGGGGGVCSFRGKRVFACGTQVG